MYNVAVDVGETFTDVLDTVGLFAEEPRSTPRSQCRQSRAPGSSGRDVV